MLLDTRWSIHVCAWNDSRYFFDLLSSLEQQVIAHPQVVLIEHAHTGAISPVQLDHRHCMVLRNTQDKGYGASHQQAIRFALSHWPSEGWSDRYIGLVHPDVVLSPECLSRVQQAFEGRPDLGIVVPNILRAKLTFSENGEEREVVFSDEVADQSTPCCLFVRASVFGKLSLKAWDEERSVRDFLKQSTRQNWKQTSLPEAVVWHHLHPLPRPSFSARVRRLLGI